MNFQKVGKTNISYAVMLKNYEKEHQANTQRNEYLKQCISPTKPCSKAVSMMQYLNNIIHSSISKIILNPAQKKYLGCLRYVEDTQLSLNFQISTAATAFLQPTMQGKKCKCESVNVK